MPVNKKMMASMVKEYGKKKASAVYYAVEAKQKKAGTWMDPVKANKREAAKAKAKKQK